MTDGEGTAMSKILWILAAVFCGALGIYGFFALMLSTWGNGNPLIAIVMLVGSGIVVAILVATRRFVWDPRYPEM